MKTFNLFLIFLLCCFCVVPQANANAKRLRHKVPRRMNYFSSFTDFLKKHKEIASSLLSGMCYLGFKWNIFGGDLVDRDHSLRFQLRTKCDFAYYPLTQVSEFVEGPFFDRTKPVLILVPGWGTEVESWEALSVTSRAAFCRGDLNVLTLDVTSYMSAIYVKAALYTEKIGALLAVALTLMIDYVPLSNIHLVGHSLGAHIVGSAARRFRMMTQLQLPRVTGLDPAKPCFADDKELLGLQRNDSAFLEVIHTDQGALGKKKSIGDVDFYVLNLDSSCTDLCAHSLAWRIYAESIYPAYENNFLAAPCKTLKNCTGPSVPMGYALSDKVRGTYYLETEPDSPYGKSRPPNVVVDKMCGVCRETKEPVHVTMTAKELQLQQIREVQERLESLMAVEHEGSK